MLYPLKFDPIYKERIWGGHRLCEQYNRICPDDKPIGESWELSGIEGDVSVVSNGALAGNEISELIEVYMGELVGDKVYRTFGEEFPLIIKLLDSNDTLSIQVHPDDKIAAERHNAYGKTEMWYVLDSDPDAEIYLGFDKPTTLSKYLTHLDSDRLPELLSRINPTKDSAFYIPAGTVHALGKGVVLVEIQQASDVTYRLFDWDRKDDNGESRELHTDLAVDVIDFDSLEETKLKVKTELNKSITLKNSAKFITNIIDLDGSIEMDYARIDSFVAYVCLGGEVVVECDGGTESLVDVETILVPALFNSVRLTGKAKLLEVYMP